MAGHPPQAPITIQSSRKRDSLAQRRQEHPVILMIAFWVFLFSACAIMLFFGKRYEKRFIIAVTTATLATFIANGRWGITTALPIVAAIDVALLLFVLICVARRDRYWPIWFAGFHLNTIATEVGSIMFPGAIPGLYTNLAGAWALPALGAAALGVMRDRNLALSAT